MQKAARGAVIVLRKVLAGLKYRMGRREETLEFKLNFGGMVRLLHDYKEEVNS